MKPLTDDTRGQKMGPPPGLIPVILTAVCIYVALDLAGEAGLGMVGKIAMGGLALVVCFAVYGVIDYVEAEYL